MPYSATNLNFTPRAWQTRRLWLTILILGSVLFFVEHDLKISLDPQYSPWSNAEQIIAPGGNALTGAARALIGLLGVFFLFDKQGEKLHLTGIVPALMFFFVVWAALSATWSIDPQLTVRRVAVLCFYFLGALGIARQVSGRELAMMALVITSAYLVVGIAAELALGTFQPWATGYRFGGTIHPNSQGFNLSILCLTAFVIARTNHSQTLRKGLFVLLFVGFIFLLLTKSRTALAAFLLAISVFWFPQFSSSKRTLVIVGGLFLICLGLLICSLSDFNVNQYALNTAMLGRQQESEALTGRLPIWSELMWYIAQRPLTGYGYKSFWTIPHIGELEDALQWRFLHAHSAYIDAVLSTGLIGAACLMLIGLIGIVRAAVKYKNTNQIEYGMTLALLFFGFVSACLESTIVNENLITLLTGCCLIQLICLRPEDGFKHALSSKQARNLYSSDSNTTSPGVAIPEMR